MSVIIPRPGPSCVSPSATNSKAHLDNIIAQAKSEISPTSKFWEPYRAYEKKLTTAMHKEKGVYTCPIHAVWLLMSLAGPGGRGRKRKGAGKSAEFVTTDEEAGVMACLER